MEETIETTEDPGKVDAFVKETEKECAKVDNFKKFDKFFEKMDEAFKSLW